MAHTDTGAELHRLGEALLARLDDLLHVHVASTRADLGEYARVAAPAVRGPAQGVWRTALRAVCLEQRGPAPDDLDRYRRLAELRAAQGVPREAFLVGLARATDNSWPLVEQVAAEVGVGADVLLQLRVRNDQWHNTVMGFVLGLQVDDDAERRRARFVADVVNGVAAHEDVAEWAAWFGVSRCSVAVTRGVPPWVRPVLAGPPSPAAGLWGQVDGSAVGLVVEPPALPAGALVGVGPAGGLDDAPRSYRLAHRSLLAAEASGRSGAVTLDAVGALAAVVHDGDLTRHLVSRYVEPVVRTGAPGTAVLATVRAYLGCGARVDETATAVFAHANTVRYRLHRYEQLTGADLRRTDVVSQVWWALLAHGLEGRTRGATEAGPPTAADRSE